MKCLWNSFKIAFSMYSKIPVPNADWTKENMKYAMCFFPLIGAVIGTLVVVWSYLLTKLPFQHDFGTAVYLLIPLLATGGIHFDGFIDTIDAKKSYQPQEKKIEILKDPHVGAFAIIFSIIYFVFAFGIWSEITDSSIYILAISFVLSRSLSGLSVVTFPLAKSSGLAATFSENAHKQKVKVTMLIYLFVCVVAMIWLNPVLGVVAVITSGVVFFYYNRTCKKVFGGMTGDLAGYFLSLCELLVAAAVIIVANFL